MTTINIEFKIDRETKGTFRFAEVVASQFEEPKVGILYLKKSLFKSAPHFLKVSIISEDFK